MSPLKRALTTFDLTMIAIGGTIGSGIFLVPSLIAQQLPDPLWILAVWGLGGLMTLCGALTFAELGSMLPNAGGMYVYLSEAFGSLAGFLFGWAYFLVVNTGGIAALSIAFATYLGYFIPLGPTGVQLVAILGLALVTALNIFGVKAGGIFSDVFTLLKLTALVGIIIVGIGTGANDLSNADVATRSDVPLAGSVAVAMVGVLWSYGGWQHASFTAGEARNPTRSVPFAMVFGSITVTVVYLLANLAYLLMLSPEQMSVSSRPAADALTSVVGPAGGSLIAITIFLSTFGSTGIYTLTVPRVYYAMASHGLFFRKVAELHPRFQTPMFAILLQSAWALILILFWGTFNELISYVVFTDWIFFGLTAGCVFVLRKRQPHATRPYRTIGYPFTPLVFIATTIWFVGNTLIEKPVQAWAGLAMLSLGVPVYYYWKKKYQK